MSINREILRNRLQWNKFAVLFSSLISHELSISPHKPGDFKVVISVESKLSNLRGLSRYQEELIRLIEEFRGKSWMYREISDYLISQGFKSSRGKDLSPQLVERMYKKYLRKVQRENQILISLLTDNS